MIADFFREFWHDLVSDSRDNLGVLLYIFILLLVFLLTLTFSTPSA